MKIIYELEASGIYEEEGRDAFYFTTMEALQVFARNYYSTELVYDNDENYPQWRAKAIEDSIGYNIDHPYLIMNKKILFDDTDDIQRIAIMNEVEVNI